MAIDISWIDSKKSRWGKGDDDAPWMEFIQPMPSDWGMGAERVVQVVQIHKNDSTSDFASWMVKTWMVGDNPKMWDGGDEYVRVILAGSRLVKVLGEEPTDEQRAEIEALTYQVLSHPDPMAALGF